MANNSQHLFYVAPKTQTKSILYILSKTHICTNPAEKGRPHIIPAATIHHDQMMIALFICHGKTPGERQKF